MCHIDEKVPTIYVFDFLNGIVQKHMYACGSTFHNVTYIIYSRHANIIYRLVKIKKIKKDTGWFASISKVNDTAPVDKVAQVVQQLTVILK